MRISQHRCWRDDERGAVSIIAALSLMMLFAIAAIVIDAGSLYLARRQLQSTSDAAALAAVQDPDNATGVAASVFAQNGYTTQSLDVATGTYTPDESLSAGQRFAASSSDVNAVQVIASLQQPNYLAGLFGLSSLNSLKTKAVAVRIPTADFGAGMRLAELDGGMANSLLGSMLGSSLSLSLVDYQSLYSTNVDALTFFNQLATDIGASGTYTNLANTEVTVGQLINALAEVNAMPGESNGQTTGAQLALQELQSGIQGNSAVQLSSVVNLTSLYGRNIGSVVESNGQGQQVNLLSLLSAGADTASAGQIVNLGTSLSVPVTGSSIATELSVGTKMAQVATAKIGTSIETAPVRIAMTVTLTNVDLGVANVTVQIPLYLEVESGSATLAAMPCTPGGTLVDLTATSGATNVQFGTVSSAALQDFSTPVTPMASPIISTSLLGIPIQVNIAGATNSAGAGPQDFLFTQADIDDGTVQSLSGGVTAPFAGLSETMTISTNILGDPGILAAALNSQLNLLTAALTPVIANVLDQLDSPSNSLLTTLGLQLGITDLRVFNASCRTPTLEG